MLDSLNKVDYGNKPNVLAPAEWIERIKTAQPA